MKRATVPVCLMILLCILGCYLIAKEYRSSIRPKRTEDTGLQTDTSEEEDPEEEELPSSDRSLQYLTAILSDADHEEKYLILKDLESDKEARLSYDGTTQFTDRFGQSITARELEYGEILNIAFSEKNGILKSVAEDDDIWLMTDVNNYSVDEKKGIFTISGEAYRFTPDIYIYSDEAKSEWMNITELDTLTVRGKDRRIYSVVVKKGHGYIRITNDSYFVGGWIEVGTDVIKPITEDMLLMVPEGDFHVTLTRGGYLGEEDVSIVRNKETILDLSRIEIEEVAIGHVEFKIEPEFAQLFIDGDITEYEDRVPLEYGIHSIRIEAAGYRPVTTSIKIGSEYANVDISLDLDETAQTAEGTSGSTQAVPSPSPVLQPTLPLTSSSYDTNVISQVKKIYIEEPRGTEVYLDGNYIGVAPVSTNKVTGSHVITLSRSGYETKSYSVDIENDGNDITFSFSELNKL